MFEKVVHLFLTYSRTNTGLVV